MKRVVLMLLTIALPLLFISCDKECDARELMDEFIYSYGIEGVVYSSDAKEGDDGFVTEGLTEKIYVYEGNFPQNYALMLNFHTDYGAECGVFVCDGAEERARVTDMCEERVALLSRGGENGIIIRTGNIVFYSTLGDRTRAEQIWNKIIRAHT